jgi:glycosyltransferase involved in cell wall biosynthesis
MPLTVIQILPALEVGGVERGTLEVASELVKRGHRSIVISGGGRMVNQLLSQGSEHITLPIGKKSLLTLRLVSRLRNILKNENVSVLHARSRLPAWISYLAWKTMEHDTRPAFVTTVHGPYTVNPYSRIMVRGEKVIAISNFIKDYIVSNYPETDINRIIVIPRGVSSDQYPYGYRPSSEWVADWNNQHPSLSGKYIVTLPARVTRWKGHEDFLQILKIALSENLPVHGLIAGGPHPGKESFLKELASSARNIGLDQHVTFLGHRDDMKEIMTISNVVFSLAREPEAFGRTALEALCLGTPVIAYNHGGAAEVMAAMFPAGAVTPLDINAATRKLKEFINQQPIVTNNNCFTLENMLSKTISVYEGLSRTDTILPPA